MWHTYTAKVQDHNGKINWSHIEDRTWSELLERQTRTLQGRACEEFIVWLENMGFNRESVPDHTELSQKLSHLTGWTVEPVPALISETRFHELLSDRRFPAASFIRIPEELDYIEEPDIFHEFFWHLPILTDQKYADFLQNFGDLMLDIEPSLRKYLSRVFWYTIEFGLIETRDGMRIYGAGILSSQSESIRALEDREIERVPFDLLTCARTPYRYDVLQSKYFFIRSFDELFSLFENRDNLLATIKRADILGDITL
jgi:phenylalanine-4-hydroxylase